MSQVTRGVKYNFEYSPEDGELHCRLCGKKVSVKVGGDYILSSESEGDEGKGICHTCLVEHCVETNCLACDWYKYPDCPHKETKKIYLERED